MYLLRNKLGAYWLYSPTKATNESSNSVQNAFVAFKEGGIWDPSDHSDDAVIYEITDTHITPINDDDKASTWHSQILAILDDDCTYRQFTQLYPELLL